MPVEVESVSVLEAHRSTPRWASSALSDTKSATRQRVTRQRVDHHIQRSARAVNFSRRSAVLRSARSYLGVRGGATPGNLCVDQHRLAKERREPSNAEQAVRASRTGREDTVRVLQQRVFLRGPQAGPPCMRGVASDALRAAVGATQSPVATAAGLPVNYSVLPGSPSLVLASVQGSRINCLAPPAGLEPATRCLEGSRSTPTELQGLGDIDVPTDARSRRGCGGWTYAV